MDVSGVLPGVSRMLPQLWVRLKTDNASTPQNPSLSAAGHLHGCSSVMGRGLRLWGCRQTKGTALSHSRALLQLAVVVEQQLASGCRRNSNPPWERVNSYGVANMGHAVACVLF